MDRRTVIAFNTVYATEATPEEKQLVNDLLTVWGKLEPAAAKSPSLYRRGILYGLALQKAITAGKVKLLPVRRNRKENRPEQTAEPGNG